MATGQILYFTKPGKQNTAAVIKAAAERAKKLKIKHIVVATTEGDTPVKMARAVKGTDIKVVAVSYHAGFWGGDSIKFTKKNRDFLEKDGHACFGGSHALSGVERSITQKFGGVSRVEIVAHTLRRFGCDGIKVAVECSVMAADAALVPTDREIIAIGGSGRGADAAIVLKAAHQNNFFDLEVREILAKARQRSNG